MSSYPVVYKEPPSIPHFDPDICNFLENFGKYVIHDDRHDIYKLSTRRHPSYNHHWISGSFMVVLAQMGTMMTKIGMYMQGFSQEDKEGQPLVNIMRDFVQGMTESLPAELEQSYNNMRTGVKEQRAIPLEAYKEELSDVPPMRYSDKPLIPAPTAPSLKK